jgi:diguanylate cyclase (GGDEF)-like protein
MLCIVPWLMLVFAVFLPGALKAQAFPVRFYGQDDGLDNQAVGKLAQDEAGHLWIATDNGLYRYDGARFQMYGRDQGLGDPRIFNLDIDRFGTVWVASPSGLLYLDGGRFHEIQIHGRRILVTVNSRVASNSSGELIVASNREGLLSVEKDPASAGWTALSYSDRHPSFRTNASVDGVSIDSHDRLWFGCGRSICGFSPPARETPGMPPQPLVTLEGVPEDGAGYDAFLEQRNGRLWARSQKSIVTWLPGEKQVREVSALPPGSQSTIYRFLIEDRMGNVLTPTVGGFATWNGSGWHETSNTSQGPIEGATGLLADREGNVWIGTPGKGLIQSLGYKQWENYTLAEGLTSQLIFGLAIDQRRRVWLGSPRGVDILLPGTSKPAASPLAREPDAHWVEQLQPDSGGGIWAATLLGHLYHIGRNDRIDRRATVPREIQRIKLDAHGNLWVASLNALYHLDCPPGQQVCNPIKLESPFSENNIPGAMQFDSQGTLWVAAISGLYAVRNGKVTHIPIHGFTGGFSEIAITPDHTFWLGGHTRGLVHVRVDGNVGTILDRHVYPELASDYVEFLGSDQKGRVWAGTDHGVNVLYHHQTTLIDMQDGLVWNDADWNSFLADSDGSVWIGTSGGLSHLLDPDTMLARGGFKAEIVRPLYGETDTDSVALMPGATTPWNSGTFLVSFTGLTFRDNRSILYHYRLEGFDNRNVETRTPFVRFQQLPPGRYNFVVVAEDRGHNTFSTPASFTFTLSPPWWRTRLCYTLESLGAAALLLLLWRWSNQALLLQRERLQRLVAERTAELEQLALTDSLTGLLNRGAIMATLTNEAAAARKRNLPLCVALVDLDHFKKINDTLGHAAGDEVLREAARRLAAAVRTSDFVGRYGGEEFLVIFRDIQKELSGERCEALRQAICESPIHYEGHELSITTSIGVAWTRGDIEVEDALVSLADRALYTAKERGRNRVELASTEPETVSNSQGSQQPEAERHTRLD